MSLCPVPTCKNSVLPGRLMCLGHWCRVNYKLQLQVLKTWNAVTRAKTPAGRKIALAAYRPAREAAIAAVTPKEDA